MFSTVYYNNNGECLGMTQTILDTSHSVDVIELLCDKWLTVSCQLCDYIIMSLTVRLGVSVIQS